VALELPGIQNDRPPGLQAQFNPQVLAAHARFARFLL
jgi:hypothetical protein